MAAKLYFNEGLKPKEIAQKLGISVNTVYKAISKYRAFTRNVDQSQGQVSNNGQVSGDSHPLSNYGNVFNVSLSIITNAVQPQLLSDHYPRGDDYQGELIKELKLLRELIGKLIEKVEELERRGLNACVPSSVGVRDYVVDDGQPSDGSLPDFIRDNPWVDVIKSIHSNA